MEGAVHLGLSGQIGRLVGSIDREDGLQRNRLRIERGIRGVVPG